MKPFITLLSLLVCSAGTSFGQNSFDYTLELEDVTVPNLPGLHSYAYAQHNDKWLVIGGRRDGLHARQPFNAFPQAQNNTDIYVIDATGQQFWTASLTSLPTAIKEQLQATNMNFCQDADTLYIAGGYAFSTTENDHITFPNLTSVSVSSLINNIVNGSAITSDFKQITDTVFAVTGGHMAKLGDTFYLVGGHRFDRRYNPMGNPTYTQTYTNKIKKFTLNNSGNQLSYANLTAITDPVHLRRRDYNLLPQIFPNGDEGFTISSGVFQLGADLPFLYPVDITATGYTPVTTFNQYLCNYHSAFACLYDNSANEMHTLFFGGMSRYYYQNGTLIEDDQVPFVKTISLLTRIADGALHEYQLPLEMPGLEGASAEFIINENLPHYESDILKLSEIQQDTILIGHILGGIQSTSLNPFSNNQTNTTSASATIYAVKLIRNTPSGFHAIDGTNPFDISVFPNPAVNELEVTFDLKKDAAVTYYITNQQGQLIMQRQSISAKTGANTLHIELQNPVAQQTLFLTFIVDDKFYVTKKVLAN